MKNIFLSGLAAALLCIAPAAYADDLSNGSWSTTDGSNTAAPPNGWPAGMTPASVEPSARANMGGVKRWWERANPTLSTTGSAGAYVLTPSNTSYPTAYTQGEVICAKANFTSVGSDTLNVNGLGAKALYNNLARIGAGSIMIGQQICASYDGALNSGAGGFQVISGIPISQTLPTRQVLTSTAGSPYVTPAGVRQLRIRLVGGGGGGASYSVTASNGIAGGTSSFNGVTAIGGGGGNSNGNAGAGGTGGNDTPSSGSIVGKNRTDGNAGNPGGPATVSTASNGGNGGAGPFGGGTANSNSAKANTGAGGSGQGISSASATSGGGGGAGENIEFIINNPGSTYTYAIGAAGAGGTGGGNGGSGAVIVDELY